MASPTTPDPADGALRQDPGGQLPMKRTLGSFQVFAISFAFISVAVGIFATYDELLVTSGPAGIWLWVLVAVGQGLVALVVAQFASRIALSGSSYQWASRMANPRIGWLFGWLTFWYLVVGAVAVSNALATQVLMPLLGMAADESTGRILTVALLAVQALLVIASTRLLGRISSAAVALEVVLVFGLVIALAVAVTTNGSGHLENLTSRGVAADAPDYFAVGGGLMAGALMGLTTLVGFDTASNMAEEARDPFRSVPRAIVASVATAGVSGLLLLIALTVAIRDIPAVSADPTPVAAILRDQLGTAPERALLVGLGLAMFGAGSVTMAACARQAFAMSRDERFPGGRLLRRVNRRTQTPIWATVLVLVVGALLMVALPGEALIQLIIGTTILPALIYGATVILYLSVRKRLERREGGFSLGRFEVPVAVAALVWVVAALLILVTPGQALIPDLIVLGVIVSGAAYFLVMLRTRPHVLRVEAPGGPAVDLPHQSDPPQRITD